jgi:Protein of unknown function (DUF2442)
MTHPICHVQEFEILAPYKARIVFTEASGQGIDFEPVLRGELFGPLRDLALFNKAALDPEARTVVWPNGADFDPATLHQRPHCTAGFIEMASQWDAVRA